VLSACAVSRAVLVQHLGEFDNAYIADCAAAAPGRLAGVCLVDHRLPDAAGELERLARTGLFRGVRFPAAVLHEAPELFAAAARLGLVIVLYAPDGMEPLVEPLDRFLNESPQARLVITHLGTPSLDEAPRFAAARSAFRLARHAGVYWQLSGMKMFCPWPHEALHPLIAGALEAFGPDRLLWGSNYPVVGTRDDYRRDLDLLISGRLPLPTDVIPAIAGGTARRLWFP